MSPVSFSITTHTNKTENGFSNIIYKLLSSVSLTQGKGPTLDTLQVVVAMFVLGLFIYLMHTLIGFVEQAFSRSVVKKSLMFRCCVCPLLCSNFVCVLLSWMIISISSWFFVRHRHAGGVCIPAHTRRGEDSTGAATQSGNADQVRTWHSEMF